MKTKTVLLQFLFDYTLFYNRILSFVFLSNVLVDSSLLVLFSSFINGWNWLKFVPLTFSEFMLNIKIVYSFVQISFYSKYSNSFFSEQNRVLNTQIICGKFAMFCVLRICPISFVWQKNSTFKQININEVTFFIYCVFCIFSN